jgi:hypothetical protein
VARDAVAAAQQHQQQHAFGTLPLHQQQAAQQQPQRHQQAAQQQQQAARRMSSAHLALSNINPGVVGGPGNRSSNTGAVATVFGCTGFVGHYIVNELAKHGTQVVCPYRSIEERAMPLKQMGDLGQVRRGREARDAHGQGGGEQMHRLQRRHTRDDTQ